jgi:hypothetical protein
MSDKRVMLVRVWEKFMLMESEAVCLTHQLIHSLVVLHSLTNYTLVPDLPADSLAMSFSKSLNACYCLTLLPITMHIALIPEQVSAHSPMDITI